MIFSLQEFDCLRRFAFFICPESCCSPVAFFAYEKVIVPVIPPEIHLFFLLLVLKNMCFEVYYIPVLTKS